MGRVYHNDNQLLLPELIHIYQPENLDWLSYQITKGNGLTVHHVVKVCDGGLSIVDNLALLTKKSHRIFHMCESRDHFLYNSINDFFLQIIAARAPLSDSFQEQSKDYKRALTKTIYK